MTSFTFIIAALYLLVTTEYAQSAEILKAPQTQYVLDGENVTFQCQTITSRNDAHWMLNGTSLSFTYQNIKKEYEDQGFLFIEEISQEYFNLTMIIPASSAFNNTEIVCAAIGSDYYPIFSLPAHLIVFHTFRPYQPSILIVEIVYSELPTVHIVINEQPRWPGYEISEFRMNITNYDNSSLLHQIITNVSGSYTLDIFEPLQGSTIDCASLAVSASAVSSLYHGESDFSEYDHNLPIFKAPGIFPANGLNLTTVHNFNNVPFPLLQVQIPDVCANQPVNYTFIIETDDDELQNSAQIREGPYFHKGPGLVYHCVNGLQGNMNYSIMVHVNSIAGSSESQKYHFDTHEKVIVAPPEISKNGQAETLPTGTGNESFKKESNINDTAMGIMIALLFLMLFTICIIFILFCAYHHYILSQITQEKNKVKSDEYGMVPCTTENKTPDPGPEPTYVNTTEPIPEVVYVNTSDGKDPEFSK